MIIARRFVNQGGDVRSSSIDRNYMGPPFQGTMKQAKAQAKTAPEYPLPNLGKAFVRGLTLSRYELLSFLRLL